LLKGLVKRRTCPSNRRKIEITITEQGIQQLEKMDRAMNAAEDKILARLSKEDLEQLNVLFDKF